MSTKLWQVSSYRPVWCLDCNRGKANWWPWVQNWDGETETEFYQLTPMLSRLLRVIPFFLWQIIQRRVYMVRLLINYSKRGGDLDRDIYFYRDKDLKVIFRANLDSWEMYDLKEEPKELSNIVDTSPEAEELKRKLKPRVRRWIS